MRFKKNLALGIPNAEIEKAVTEDPMTAKWTDGKPIRKIIIVPGKIINIVI